MDRAMIAQGSAAAESCGCGVSGQTCFEWFEPEMAMGERDGACPTSVAGLSDRETEVTRLLGSGNSAKEAAAILGISMKTVDNHRQNAMRKLGLKCRAEMVLFAVKNGLVRV